jgi:hypothetical protein
MSKPKKRPVPKRRKELKQDIRKTKRAPQRSKSKKHSISYWILPFIVPILALIPLFIYQDNIRLYISLTHEDGIVEWITFLFLFVSGLLALSLAPSLKKRSDRYFIFFLLFGIGFILFSLEEISWGQRIFGFESPEFFLEQSDQQETNIHNVLQNEFNFKTKHVTGWILFFYGGCLPLLCLINFVEKITRILRLKIPPVSLIPSFLVGSAYMIDKPIGVEEEYGELLLSLCLLIFIGLEFSKSIGFKKH